MNAQVYSDLLYGSPKGTGENNCYAYALDYYKNSGHSKLQPGDLAGVGGSVNLRNCADLITRALADAAAMGWSLRYLGSKDPPCCKGSYKIVAVVAPNEDFHWYRYHDDVLYRVKTRRTISQLAEEFGVPTKNVEAPRGLVKTGDVVLIRGAGVWSHKQGFSADGPLLRDACGRLIKDPRKACRSYGSGLDYTEVCGAFCFAKT
jgi:hypothetical protein